jgi:hypothetical protein
LDRWTFVRFNQETSKSKNLSLSDFYSKMLFQIPNINIQKVLSIIEKYPTLNQLLTAYDLCSEENTKKYLFENFKFGNDKKFGKKTSLSLYNMFCIKDYSKL